jgi:hypothetical protein
LIIAQLQDDQPLGMKRYQRLCDAFSVIVVVIKPFEQICIVDSGFKEISCVQRRNKEIVSEGKN